MEEIIKDMAKNGYQIDSVIADGKIHRFGKSKNNWYTFSDEYVSETGELFYYGAYGSWKSGEKINFTSDKKMTRDQRNSITKKIIKKQDEIKEERNKLQEETAKSAEHLWNISKESHSLQTQYLKNKKVEVPGLRGTINDFDDDMHLIVPCFDIDGKIWGTQSIYDNSDKFFTTGQRIQGVFCPIPLDIDLSGRSVVYVCEGLATGASIHQATNEAVICAFNAGNLKSVCKEVRRKYPDLYIIVCCDNDQWTKNSTGELENIGVEKGREAAESVVGECVAPVFKKLDNMPTDFNDLHVIEGIDEVKNQIKKKKPKRNYVKCLGFNEKTFYYTSSMNKSLVKLGRGEHTQNSLSTIMPTAYWESLFPGKNGPDYNRAFDYLLTNCVKAGTFVEEMTRSHGVYMEDGKIVVHLGDRLYIDGEFRPVHEHGLKTKNFYEMAQPIDINLNNELSTSEGMEIIDAFKMIKTRGENDYIYMAGFLACAQIFSILDWRPYLWFTGTKGCGKTTVANFIKDLTRFSLQTTDGTAMGISSATKKHARLIIFDEAEPNNKAERNKMNAVISYARQCSRRSKNVILRGNPDGTSRSANTEAIFCFLSIQMPAMTSADETRIFNIDILKDTDPENGEKIIDKMHDCARLQDKLLVRMVKNAKLFKKNIKSTISILRSLGMGARQADQLSAIIVGYFSLTNNGQINKNFVSEVVDLINFKDSEYYESSNQSEAEHCYDSIMQVRVGNSTRRIGTIIERLATDEKVTSFDLDDLSYYGIKVFPKDRNIFIMSKSANLLESLRNITHYADDYIRLLRNHPSFVKYSKSRVSGLPTPRNGVFLKY